MRYLPYLLLFIYCSSCSGDGNQQSTYAGGSISLAMESKPSQYDPFEVDDFYSASILGHVFEGLVSLDPKNLLVRPQLAEKWEVSDDGLNYAFVIRKDVYFHENENFHSENERKLSPSDVVFSIHKACAKNKQQQATYAYSFLYKDVLSGAKEYFEGTCDSIRGLRMSGDTIFMTLNQLDDNFLNKMASVCASIVSKKIAKKSKQLKPIGTGPFLLSDMQLSKTKKIILLKNTFYYMKDAYGNSLPYLDSVIYYIEPNKWKQLRLFTNKKIDLLTQVPSASIESILEGRMQDFNAKPPKLAIYNNPLLTTNYYFFNMTDPRFANRKVRQAFNLAIDKEKLGREILKNQYFKLGYFGIVPPIENIFKGYSFQLIQSTSYAYNPEKARKLFMEAGFKDGSSFGEVEVQVLSDDLHAKVVEEISKHLRKNLGVKLKIKKGTFEQRNEAANKGDGSLFQSAWTGDYVSPESFLINFYGVNAVADTSKPSPVNPSRYINPLFDQYLNEAKMSGKKTIAMRNFCKAEWVLMNNPPIIPLWYSGDIQIVQTHIRNLHFNALHLFDLRSVYLKQWTLNEYQKKQLY